VKMQNNNHITCEYNSCGYTSLVLRCCLAFAMRCTSDLTYMLECLSPITWPLLYRLGLHNSVLCAMPCVAAKRRRPALWGKTEVQAAHEKLISREPVDQSGRRRFDWYLAWPLVLFR